MRHHFTAEQWLPYPVEIVFAFFATPENLPRLMPAWQHARIEEASFAPPPPRPAGRFRFGGIAAGAGTTMTLSFRPFPYAPMRVGWQALIDEFAWNDHFCDTQEKGPFAFWHHCHHIAAETRDGVEGSIVRDQLEYEMPLGPLGEIGRMLFVQAQLKSTFKYRQDRTEALLKQATAPAA